MMAAVTTTPARVTVGMPVSIAGTAFAVSTPCTITIAQIGSRYAVTTDVGGAFASLVLFTPQHQGFYDITVTDGTTTVNARLEVWT